MPLRLPPSDRRRRRSRRRCAAAAHDNDCLPCLRHNGWHRDTMACPGTQSLAPPSPRPPVPLAETWLEAAASQAQPELMKPSGGKAEGSGRPSALPPGATLEHLGFPAKVCAEGAACVDETVAGSARGCGRPSALPQGATDKVVNEDERSDAASPGRKTHTVAA